MKLSLTEEQAMIQDMARKFARNTLAPVAARLDRAQDKDADRALFLDNLKQLAALGFMGLNVNSAYRGSEAGVVAFSLAVTEVARACASTAVTMSVTNMVGEVIQAIASEEQKLRYLPRLCAGDYPAGAFCLSEAGAGSDPAGMKTTAVKDGDEWVLNGTKMWISSAEYAGVFVVWAVTDPGAKKGRGISCFLIEAGTPGLIIGKAEEKMGQQASATNTVIFEDCRVPASALMGKLNDGFRIAVGELAGGRIGIGSLALGVGQAAMDYARQYTTERAQFGSAIASMQGPQWMMADAYTQLEAARLLLMNAAYLKQEGLPYSKQAAMAKLHATETANQVCYTAIQLMGGLGYTREVPLERYARDARVTSIYEGTSEIQRVIIARELLQEI
ncbi:acyl-CoA dehydrogenase family protein [Parahaliea mediterranea]|uniref:3-sulfinopropanoyl-CoA desulfinase n=1 Tax=Parahaliea mediterranea TaxID=651086 RepID=A0A939DBG4_9GAMM|nr:acyl-CoA dehydrogenase family protein [Parahaliea mediterranea]MBN7794989.1 acyl-CoA dehydrogenase family protein [Parahaliea mediterranea]